MSRLEQEPYGRGFGFPLRRSPTGGVGESAGEERVEESIRLILGTRPGERLMRPTFGSGLKSLLFAPNSPATANVARHYVETALRDWEPRIDVVHVDVEPDPDQARLVITVHYTLRATQARRRLVHPFLLEPA